MGWSESRASVVGHADGREFLAATISGILNVFFLSEYTALERCRCLQEMTSFLADRVNRKMQAKFCLFFLPEVYALCL